MFTRKLIQVMSCLPILGILLLSCSQTVVNNPTKRSTSNLYVSTTVTASSEGFPSSTPTFLKTTPTSSPLPTLSIKSETITPTTNSDNFSQNVAPYIVIRDLSGPIVVIPLRTSDSRVLLNDNNAIVKSITIGNNGCGIIAYLSNQKIVNVDLNGKVLQEILPSNWYKGPNVLGNVDFSPNGEAFTYVLGSGRSGYDSFEKQNIVVKNYISGKEFHLTNHEGGWISAWSPEGNRIAYTDFDENNNTQIYLTDLKDMLRKKLSSLDGNELKIVSLDWSPDGKKIAFRFETLDNKIRTGIINDIFNNPFVTYVPDTYDDATTVLWQTPEILMIKSKNNMGDIITWVDSETFRKITKLDSSEGLNNSILSPKPYDSSTIGFFSNESFYSYNYKTNNLQKHFDSYFSPEEWIFSPVSFFAEENCK